MSGESHFRAAAGRPPSPCLPSRAASCARGATTRFGLWARAVRFLVRSVSSQSGARLASAFLLLNDSVRDHFGVLQSDKAAG